VQALIYKNPNDALAAQQFLADRLSVGLPVASFHQVKRAERLIAGNPTLRRYSTPLGVQQLALEMPMTRKDRKIAKIELAPRVVRTGDEAEVTAPLARVEQFLEERPGITPEAAALEIAGQAGYDGHGLGIVLKRVSRFTDGRADRPCGHIREKCRMLDAIAKAALILKARAEAAE
jgi:hypothetical protein